MRRVGYEAPHGVREKSIQNYSHKISRDAITWEAGVDERLIWRYILKSWGVRVWKGFRWLRIGLTVCKHGSETSGSIKAETFLSAKFEETPCVYNFGFRGWVASNVENYTKIRQTLQFLYLEGEYVMVGRFWKPTLPLHQSAPSNPTRHLLPALHKASKTPNHCIFTLKIATAMFVETLDNFQHSSRFIPETRSCTLNSSCENLRTRNSLYLDLFQLESWNILVETEEKLYMKMLRK
jgi:hypothetical protein